MIHSLNEFVVKLLGQGDKRVEGWPLVRSPLPTLALCLSYVAFVKVIGPRLMRDRQPFSIRWLMVTYNLTMVLVSTWIFVMLGVYGWFGKYNYCCQPVDYSNSGDSIGMASTAYWYYITKFVEFADTVFFVLRKKNDHITNLHVIHHGVMPMSVWWGIKFTPGGHSTFFAFINSFVHILMYIYYGLSAIGPQMNKYLFWKKHMTAIQMVQFVAIFVHSFQLLFRECDYPRGFMWWIGFHAVLFWFLFWDFFVNTYNNHKMRHSRKTSPTTSSIPHREAGTTFFSCSQGTEAFISNMNEEDAAERRRETSVLCSEVSRQIDHISSKGSKDL